MKKHVLSIKTIGPSMKEGHVKETQNNIPRSSKVEEVDANFLRPAQSKVDASRLSKHRETKAKITHLHSSSTNLVYHEPFFENLINEEKLLTKEDVANFLSVSIKKIDRLVSMEEIPFYKIGRNVRFSKMRVLAWIKETNPTR